MIQCSICGNDEFKAGPYGRTAKNGNAQLPRCTQCKSLERHRIIRKVYDGLPDAILAGKNVLQFSTDIGAPKDRFESFEVSVYGGENSLDLCMVERDDHSYDWVIANHVIEHVEDDRAAMQELLRIVNPEGVLQMSVPETFMALETNDYGQPIEEEFFHWRSYGSDFPLRFREELDGIFGLQAIAVDDVTECWDVVYLFTPSRQKMQQLGEALYAADLMILRAC